MHSSEKLDELLEQLRVILDGVAVVTRPRKNATLKLLRLGDSINKEKVSAVVSFALVLKTWTIRTI